MNFSRTSLPPAAPLWFSFSAFVLLMAVMGAYARAQESSSRPGDASTSRDNLPSMPAVKNAEGRAAVSVAANGPAAALRDVLQAACSQNASQFSRYLVARSKESF
jgi:hypothetical protein